MSMETIRLIRDGKKWGKGYGGWGRGRLYTCCYTATTRMTPALRWAATSVILCFINCEGQGHKTVSTNHNLFEAKGEPKCNRAEAVLLTSLTPYHLSFTSYNIYYITPITRHCHATILPSTRPQNNIARPKTDKCFSSPFNFSSFFTV